jgi:hypothetical protein
MQHVVKVEKERSRPFEPVKKGRGRSVATIAVCVPLLALCVYSVVMRPAFIWGEGARPPEPARQEANVRFGMFMLAQRINQHRFEFGALPGSLVELGDSLEGISYVVVSDSVFELRGNESGKPIAFRSDGNADQFLGNSVNLIAGRAAATDAP